MALQPGHRPRWRGLYGMRNLVGGCSEMTVQKPGVDDTGWLLESMDFSPVGPVLR